VGSTPQADAERRDTVQDAGDLRGFLGGVGLGPAMKYEINTGFSKKLINLFKFFFLFVKESILPVFF